MEDEKVEGEKIKVMILGKLLGHADDWDEVDLCCLTFYNFFPTDEYAQTFGVLQAKNCLDINFLEDTISITFEGSEAPDVVLSANFTIAKKE